MIEIKLQLIKLYCKFLHVESFFFSLSHSLYSFPHESNRMDFVYFFLYIFWLLLKFLFLVVSSAFHVFFLIEIILHTKYTKLFPLKVLQNKMKDMNNIKGDSFKVFHIFDTHGGNDFMQVF